MSCFARANVPFGWLIRTAKEFTGILWGPHPRFVDTNNLARLSLGKSPNSCKSRCLYSEAMPYASGTERNSDESEMLSGRI
jgi:hypothetical protein